MTTSRLEGTSFTTYLAIKYGGAINNKNQYTKYYINELYFGGVVNKLKSCTLESKIIFKIPQRKSIKIITTSHNT